MSTEKLSSCEVPQRFAEWLLAMGCPVEKVPSDDKIKQMSRGQYYMVWRSLIEHVQAKDVIHQKRLQVFYDDVKLCKEKNAFKTITSSIVIPEQILVWKQHEELEEKIVETEILIDHAQSHLKELTEKISCKIIQHKTLHRLVEDIQRRSWLLRLLKNELCNKKANWEETNAIANLLCNIECNQDIQTKLSKCLTQNKPIPMSNPVASSSIASSCENEVNNTDKEDIIMSLVKGRGDILWPLLHEKRAAIVAKLTLANTKVSNDVVNNRFTPQSVLAHTAALHCNIAIDTMKNKVHLKRTQERFAASIEDMSNYITGEACELLVLRCEKARSEARVKSLKTLLEELISKTGVFHVNGDHLDDGKATPQKIANVDRQIENTRDDLTRLIMSLASTERKINNVRDCLIAVFNSFHNNSVYAESERSRGIQLDFPKEPIPVLKQYYTEKCEKNRNKINISLDLDVSDTWYTDIPDSKLRFIDELKIYLKKFNLEQNRKLILDSGEQIWIFETLEALISKLNTKWLNDGITPLLCPSVCLSQMLQELIYRVQEKDILNNIVKTINVNEKPWFDIDISSQTENESELVDKLKKKISENLSAVQKISKALDISKENLQFWSEDQMKNYISDQRTVDGKTFEDFEAFYMKHLKFK